MNSTKRLLIASAAVALLALACSGSAARVKNALQPVEQKSTTAPRTTLMTEQPLKLPLANPHIEVSKGKRELRLYDGTKLLRTYHVGLGFSPVEDKVRAGDGRTPEGEFYVCVKNANSKFYLSLGISYPNIEDANRGLRDELITKRQHDQIADAMAAGIFDDQGNDSGFLERKWYGNWRIGRVRVNIRSGRGILRRSGHD